MGQAKRRKEALGFKYGTPEGSNRPLVAYQGFTQSQLDRKALRKIANAKSQGIPVLLIGTHKASPLAEAAGLPWIHELQEGVEVPRWAAWNPQICEEGGPSCPSECFDGALLILGAGFFDYVSSALGDLMPLVPGVS
jgi:hypothetical protein